jgi:hypothetical protein
MPQKWRIQQHLGEDIINFPDINEQQQAHMD